jgi:hypothetical protein
MVILAVEIKIRFQKKIKVVVFLQLQAWQITFTRGTPARVEKQRVPGTPGTLGDAVPGRKQIK